MSVQIVTSLGDLVVDLHTDKCPLTCKNFLKLCKINYYNGSLFHNVQKDFTAHTGDPTATGTAGDSIYKFIYGDQARFFSDEIHIDLKHSKTGTFAMASAGENLNASQFYITLRDDLDYLDGKHTVFGELAEGLETLTRINEAYVDEKNRPYKNIRIKHTYILEDPYDDPAQLAEMIPDASPEGKPKDEMSSTGPSLIISKYATGKSEGNSPLWAYVTIMQDKKEGGGNVSWHCNYCNSSFKSSYYRVRAHLLRDKGKGISICSQVSTELVVEMEQLDRIANEKAQSVQVPLPTGTTSMNPPSGGSKRRREIDGPLKNTFNVEQSDHLHCEIARLFYSAGLPFNVARNPHFVNAFSYAANNSLKGFLPPSYNAIRTTLLQKEKANIQKLLQPIKDTWVEKGVSIITDGWTDVQRRPLINFMAATDSAPMFLKATDCLGEVKDMYFIANEILAVISEVGAENVVQVITDNAPVCKAAGSIVESQYPHIFWTPCVVHTLNLALKNICAPKHTPSNEDAYSECHWIHVIVDAGSIIKNFIVNHAMRLAMFNKYSTLKLLAIAETTFASTIIMLKRLRKVRHVLQSMVITEEWDAYRTDDVENAKSVKEMIIDDAWWHKVDYILSFTKPIYDMLRFCDNDRPNLHLVYEQWDTMIENVKTTIYQEEGKDLNEHSSFWIVVHNILISRWTKSSTPLHCLAHSLNPRYYCRQWIQEDPNRVYPYKDSEICKGRNQCLRRYFPDANEMLQVTSEFVAFSSASGELGQFDCLHDRWNLEPKEWWFMYGSVIPKIQSIALKLLSQPCSSSCCERNWSTYSFIHSLKRNRLLPKRAEDLVFVHSNLRLLSRKSKSYIEGETRMWDIAGDEWDEFTGAGMLEVATLSLDEPDMEGILFCDDGEGNDEIEGVSFS